MIFEMDNIKIHPFNEFDRNHTSIDMIKMVFEPYNFHGKHIDIELFKLLTIDTEICFAAWDSH